MPTDGLMMVSVRSVRPVLERARALGLEVDSILSTAGADPSILRDADARIPHELALALWHEAVRRSGDDAFGIHAAEEIRPGAFDVLDYATRSSATLGEGLARLVRYHRLLHDAARVELALDEDRAVMTHTLPGDVGGLPRQVAEFIVAAWIVVARQATGTDLEPIEVRFRHAAPTDLREHRRLFRAPIRFDCPVMGIVLDRALLDCPLVKSDPGLCAVLERHVAELLERTPHLAVLSERVRELVAKELSTGIPGTATIARRLHMSPRTLQRHLRAGGTSHRDLVDTLRRDLALRYLAEQRIAIGEVAFLLGFSETSAFHRAFKRWTRTTPAEYRRSRLA